MTVLQQIITILVCTLATVLTRFLPFLIFGSNRSTPRFVLYLGKALPCAVFGLLVVYCLKNVEFLKGYHGAPEAISIALTVIIHLWKNQWLLSIVGGTLCYMLLVQFVFV